MSIKCKGVELENGNSVMLGEIGDRFIIIFKRPVDGSDTDELPQYASIKGDELLTIVPLSKEAMEALVFVYLNKEDCNE